MMVRFLAIPMTMHIEDDPPGVHIQQALIRLLSWLSPSFPTGAFAYSHGLENAVHAGLVSESDELHHWIRILLRNGSGWNDAVIFSEASRLAHQRLYLTELAGLAEAMAGSAERHMETTAQGRAFLVAAEAWPESETNQFPAQCPLPVAVGAVAGRHGIPIDMGLTAFLHGFSNNLVQAALRLMPLGQQAGVEIMHALETDILAVSQRAARSSLDDLGSATIVSEVASLRHETQTSRIFRS